MLIKTKIGQKREADTLGRWEFCLFWGVGGGGRAGPNTGLFPENARVQGSLALFLQQKLNTVNSLDKILGQAVALTGCEYPGSQLRRGG